MQRLKNIWTPRSLTVVFVKFEGSVPHFSALKVKQKEMAAGDIPAPQQFDSLKEITAYYGKTGGYHFHIQGSGVLERKVESVSNFRDDLIINGNSDEFFFTSFDDETNIAAAFFRVELIAFLQEEIEQLKLHLMGISSGSVPMLILDNDLTLNFQYSISKKNGLLTVYRRSDKSEDKQLWKGSYYLEKQLLAWAIFQQLIAPTEELAYGEQDIFKDAKENLKQFNQFRVFGISLLSAILLSLVGNYFYQNSLNQQIAQLEENLSVSNSNLALLDRLEQEKQRKEQLVLNAGVNSTRFLAFYLDAIGKTVPKKITLQEMEMFPLTNKLKNKRKVEIDQHSILLSGSTAGNEILDDWMEQMDRFEWVQSVELLNYLKDENDRANFILTITIGH